MSNLIFQTGEFDWSDELQGVILSSFAYGYIATQLLSGYLAGRFGAKKTLFCGIVLSTVCTLVGPLASIATPYLLITTQVLNGLGQVCSPLYFSLYIRQVGNQNMFQMVFSSVFLDKKFDTLKMHHPPLLCRACIFLVTMNFGANGHHLWRGLN